jgi:hypothetical protein
MRFGIVYEPPMDSSKEQYHVEGIHYREVGPELTLWCHHERLLYVACL